MYQNSWFVSCLICYNVEISETVAPTWACFVLLESPWRGGVHQLDFMMFECKHEEILNFKLLWHEIRNTYQIGSRDTMCMN